MKEAVSTSVNTPRVKPPLDNFSQVCTVLLTQQAFTYRQPVLVLITTIIMALNALAPAASPYRLLYQYVLVPQGWLKPRSVEEGKLAPYRFSRISAALLLVSTILLFFAPALAVGGLGLGWLLTMIVALLMMADLGVRLSIWVIRNLFSSTPLEWYVPIIPKKTIGLLYLLGRCLIVASPFLVRSPSDFSNTPPPTFVIGAILYMTGWVATLANVTKARSCLWFLSQILFPLTPLTLPIYIFFGPLPTERVSDGSPNSPKA